MAMGLYGQVSTGCRAAGDRDANLVAGRSERETGVGDRLAGRADAHTGDGAVLRCSCPTTSAPAPEAGVRQGCGSRPVSQRQMSALVCLACWLRTTGTRGLRTDRRGTRSLSRDSDRGTINGWNWRVVVSTLYCRCQASTSSRWKTAALPGFPTSLAARLRFAERPRCASPRTRRRCYGPTTLAPT